MSDSADYRCLRPIRKEMAAVNDEAARLDALRDLAVLDTPPEPGLDELVQFARRRFGMPNATPFMLRFCQISGQLAGRDDGG
jgi:hypothetical protein